jgi:S1-C subfamily serine protease
MKGREFFRVLCSTAAWIAAAFLLISGGLHNSAAQAADTAYAKIGWWQINYREYEDWNGCLAVSKFRDQTLIYLALLQLDKGKAWFMYISNPGWNSWIKKKKQHTLRFVTTKAWQDTFFANSETGELYAGDLSIEFMNTIADANTLAIFDENNRLLASLDMKDSANAIKSVVNCVRDHPRLPSREAEVPPKADTPPKAETTTFSGTGFFVAPNLFVTNNHVISACRKPIHVRYPEQMSYEATISGHDRANDLALLHTDMSGLSVVSFRLGPRLGEMVATYGFPYSGILSSSGNFTLGNLTSMTGMGDDTRFLQMSTPIQPGNSGGPLLDMSGAVVGVVVSQLSAVNMMKAGDGVPQNVNFAIQAPIVTNFLSIKGVTPKLNSVAPQTLSPSDVADVAKKFTVQIYCEADPRMAKGDVPVSEVAYIAEKSVRPQPPLETGALSRRLATIHSRGLLQRLWRRLNRENVP